MIDYSQYDGNKIKPEDQFMFRMAEQMNMIEWDTIRPVWHRARYPFYPSPMPAKYHMEAAFAESEKKQSIYVNKYYLFNIIPTDPIMNLIRRWL